ncbi:MAG TPA: DUF4199 family protein [Candidatus Kapabacteria bacterium]|nr:DUF4199 family protein [Candidatus Kapabacteria bacterium]
MQIDKQAKHELMYGVYIGLGVSVWVLLEFFLGFHTTRMELGQYSGFFSILIPIFFLMRALKEKRVEKGGDLSLKEGIKTGVIVSFAAASVLTLFFWAYNTRINPSWMEHGLAFETKRLELSGVSPEEVQKRITAMKEVYTLPNQLLGVFVGTILQSIFLTLILTIIIRRGKGSCQSCGMPLSKDVNAGRTERDGTKSRLYCSNCYDKGAFTLPHATAVEMQERVRGKLKEYRIPSLLIPLFVKGIPRLKRWKKS